MKKILASLFLLTSGTGEAFAASSASLSAVDGKVLVDQGRGFLLAKGTMTLRPGDHVVTGAASSAKVSMTQCLIRIPAMATFTVPSKLPCTSGKELTVRSAFEARQNCVLEAGKAICPAFAGVDDHAFSVVAITVTSSVMTGIVGLQALNSISRP